MGDEAKHGTAHAAAVVETVRHPLLVLDAERCITSANPAFCGFFRVRAEAVLGQRFPEAIGPPWSTTALGSMLGEVLLRGEDLEDYLVEGEIPGFGCRSLVVGARRLTIYGEPVEPAALLVAFEDVTERKRYERELAEHVADLEKRSAQLLDLSGALDGFALSVSHDLRAPLRAIDGFSRILLEDHGTKLDEEGLRVVGVIRRNSEKMSRLIDELLAFSRFGRQPLTTSRIDMLALAEAAMSAVREPGRRIELCVDPDLPKIVGDRALIRQVWLSLLGNAVKFTRNRADPQVTVTSREATHDGRAELVYSVRDNGVGFDMRHVHKLFGVFQRLHPTSDFEGMGVGLALVQRVVERHGGRVWAESEVGAGSVFSFALPSDIIVDQA